MILTLILVFAALATILVLLRAARGQSVAIAGLEDLQGRTTAIDMAAFRNLVDPQEEKFLRDNLPPKEFSSIQRQRTRAAIVYVRCAAQNAAILLRLGEAARHHSNPQSRPHHRARRKGLRDGTRCPGSKAPPELKPRSPPLPFARDTRGRLAARGHKG